MAFLSGSSFLVMSLAQTGTTTITMAYPMARSARNDTMAVNHTLPSIPSNSFGNRPRNLLYLSEVRFDVTLMLMGNDPSSPSMFTLLAVIVTSRA